MEHNAHWSGLSANMIPLTKAGGLVVMTGATTGHREHRTTRTSAEYSPFSIGIGRDFYRSLTATDFRRATALREWLSKSGLFSNRYSSDLYFVGVHHGASTPWYDRVRVSLQSCHCLMLWWLHAKGWSKAHGDAAQEGAVPA
jgi:hypothetical protein